MKNICSTLALLFTCTISNAQNLIPDPGFEDTSSMFCGIFLTADFNSSMNHWYTPTQGTPDLYSTTIAQSCWNYQPNSSYNGPIGIKGSQAPHRGSVFAGIGCYTIPGFNQREYIQSLLTTPMTSGSSYYVEFFASLPENQEKYVNRLGVYFSDSAVTAANDQPLSFTPQVSATSAVSDTGNWVKVSGTFQASSAFQYITIGNFYDDANTITYANPGGSSGPGCYGAYYYIDDITVTFVTGVSERDPENFMTVYPNPFNEQLYVNLNSGRRSEIIIYDLVSRELFREVFSKETRIQTEQLSPGIYLYEIKDQNGIIKKEKLIKE